MADLAAMRTYLRDVIGITDPVERRQAIQDEGLAVISDFVEFDKDGIETLCATVRKPGGTIPNPNAGNAGAPVTIPNPGYSIPAICEKRLVSPAYAAGIYDMVSRPITQVSMGRARLKKFDAHKLLVSQHEDPEKLPVVSRTFVIMKAMDLVPSYLRERLGVRKVSLSYVIRDTVAPGAIPEQAQTEQLPQTSTPLWMNLLNTVPMQMTVMPKIMLKCTKSYKIWFQERRLNHQSRLSKEVEMEGVPTLPYVSTILEVPNGTRLLKMLKITS